MTDFWNILATVVYPALFFVFGCYAVLALIGHVVVKSRAKQVALYMCAAIFAAGLALTNGYLAFPGNDIAKPIARLAATLALLLLLHQLLYELIELRRHGRRSECH